MLVYHDGDCWETEDVSSRIIQQLKDSAPNKKIHLVRQRDGFEKIVEIQELEFQNEHRC